MHAYLILFRHYPSQSHELSIIKLHLVLSVPQKMKKILLI